MAIAPMEDFQDLQNLKGIREPLTSAGPAEVFVSRGTNGPLSSARAALVRAVEKLTCSGRSLSRNEAVSTLVEIEGISRTVDHLQVLAAGLAESLDLATAERHPDSGSLTEAAAQSLACTAPGAQANARTGQATSGTSTGGEGGRGTQRCAEYLRDSLGISRAEAKRRLVLAHRLLPAISPTGAVLDPPLQYLAEASGTVSGRAATIICAAVDRVRCIADPEQLASMDHHLTRQAIESDEDVLRTVARRWENVLDQDGREPTDKILRARQGVFLKGRRHGLNLLEIGATDDQFEYLATVMNTATNPRTAGHPGAAPAAAGSADAGEASADSSVPGESKGGPERPTRAQSMLVGLVGACKIALSGTQLPATGGHRPQVMVTIGYRDLLADFTTGSSHTAGGSSGPGLGRAVFADHLSARSIRQIACDADIIPLVLGGSGQVLDVGRASRLFPPHLRRALVARDVGCAFPDCTIPASWCEAHHTTPWSRGGVTSIDNGVLLCAHHHHTIHQGHWTVESRNGIPWFIPPAHLARHGTTARRNRYWNAQPDLPTSRREDPDATPTPITFSG